MAPVDIDAYAVRSRALDLSGIDWDDVPRHPLSPEVLRTLRYMQDIESHTIVYLRTLLSTRAMDDPEVATLPRLLVLRGDLPRPRARPLPRRRRASGHAPAALAGDLPPVGRGTCDRRGRQPLAR